jgi:hypothetical protein
LHISELEDFDDFYWHHATWYAMRERKWVRALVMVYSAGPFPVVLALCEGKEASLQGELIRSIFHLLQRSFYGYVTFGTE